mmetsp:Transcript_68575/g.198644  ORF Transcript_68575/g.198644 Transcript_68575/m.198644 type:complete len:200 (+) Transcript_68575:275-874(+)
MSRASSRPQAASRGGGICRTSQGRSTRRSWTSSRARSWNCPASGPRLASSSSRRPASRSRHSRTRSASRAPCSRSRGFPAAITASSSSTRCPSMCACTAVSIGRTGTCCGTMRSSRAGTGRTSSPLRAPRRLWTGWRRSSPAPARLPECTSWASGSFRRTCWSSSRPCGRWRRSASAQRPSPSKCGRTYCSPTWHWVTR